MKAAFGKLIKMSVKFGTPAAVVTGTVVFIRNRVQSVKEPMTLKDIKKD